MVGSYQVMFEMRMTYGLPQASLVTMSYFTYVELSIVGTVLTTQLVLIELRESFI